ncbi:MAG: cysteine desulfurase NifS, partial [Anaerolinea sp.]|nr:cysteine desulfurase NifS [Anaerolinea sp.]
MLPYFKDTFGNPSSTHQYGQKAEGAVEHARELIASLINCSHNEVVFTSGGTEADNMALRGAAFSRKSSAGANRILITPVEHDAILNTAKQLQAKYGFQIEYIPVDKAGKVDISTFSTMLDSNVAIVSVIYGNNEIGTINPVTEIGGLCHEYGIP